MLSTNTVILGAGWAGLLVAHKLREQGVNDVTILEKDYIRNGGGLLKSETIDGFTFDCGGPHLLFSRNSEILSKIKSFLGSNCSRKKRNNFVLFDSQYVPYPFENGIYMLDTDRRIQFVKEIIDRMLYMTKRQDWIPANFLEWINIFFGEHMSKEYLIPYNKKIWKRPLEKMAADWVFSPGRLPFPNLDDLLKAAAGIKNVGYKEQAYFYYPKKGGIQSLHKALYEKVANQGTTRIIENEKVLNLKNNENKYFIINNKIVAKRVVSTIPLPETLIALDDSPESKQLSEQFDWNGVIVVGVAVRGKGPNQTSIYVPDPKIVFHRYTWMSSLIPPADRQNSNLIAEITFPKNKTPKVDEINGRVIKDLANIGALRDENDVIFSKVWINQYGYPIYSLNHNKIRDNAFERLRDLGIESVGRWGSWHYWNTDMVYDAVLKLTKKELI
ncbi:MAG: NAD(P)-binding protein [Candidatus Parvarchaeota archaeon]